FREEFSQWLRQQDGVPKSGIFFFQAEDGIRDGHVTGVQTCALPICAAAALRRRTSSTSSSLTDRLHSNRPCRRPHRLRRRLLRRSEERRVGKECRSRGLTQHGKKDMCI